MDGVDIYTYAIGTSEEITSQDSSGLEHIDSLENAVSKLIDEPSSFLPSFIGVYQEKGLVPSSAEDNEELEDHNGFINSLTGFVNSLGKILLLYENRIQDSLPPNLIHVVYPYQKNLKNDHVKMFFQDPYSRLGFSSTNDVPNFYEKDTSVPFSLAYETLKTKFYEESDPVKTNDLITSLTESKDLYGLTSTEFAVLHLTTSNQGSKLIYDPQLISRASSILDLFPKHL